MLEDINRLTENINSILELLPKDANYYFCKANIPRGLDAILLKEMANQKNLNGVVFRSVKEAFLVAKKHANSDDLIFIGGSTFVVAEVL